MNKCQNLINLIENLTRVSKNRLPVKDISDFIDYTKNFTINKFKIDDTPIGVFHDKSLDKSTVEDLVTNEFGNLISKVKLDTDGFDLVIVKCDKQLNLPMGTSVFLLNGELELKEYQGNKKLYLTLNVNNENYYILDKQDSSDSSETLFIRTVKIKNQDYAIFVAI